MEKKNGKREMKLSEKLTLELISTMMVTAVALAVTAFAIFSWAWFSSNQHVSAADNSVTVDAELFELKVDANSAAASGAISLMTNRGYDNTIFETNAAHTDIMCDLIIDSYYKGERETSIRPGSYGRLVFTIIPKKNNLTFAIDLALAGIKQTGATTYEYISDSEKANAVLNGHILFFKTRTGTDWHPSGTGSPGADATVTLEDNEDILNTCRVEIYSGHTYKIYKSTNTEIGSGNWVTAEEDELTLTDTTSHVEISVKRAEGVWSCTVPDPEGGGGNPSFTGLINNDRLHNDSGRSFYVTNASIMNTEYKVTVYWVWARTFYHLGTLLGKMPDNVTDKIQDMLDHQLADVNYYIFDIARSDDSSQHYITSEERDIGYNNADQIIGDEVKYIVAELKTEAYTGGGSLDGQTIITSVG